MSSSSSHPRSNFQKVSIFCYKMKIQSFVVLCILVMLNFAHSQAAKPGDACPNGTECANDVTFLECDPTTKLCQCQNLPMTYFDQFDNKCHKFTDQPCDTKADAVPCPVNGGCNTFLVPPSCQCMQSIGFMTTPTNKCAKPYQVECAATTECDQDAFVQCLGEPKRCDCDPLTSKHDSALQECVLNLLEPCKASTVDKPAQRCGQWAECKSKENGEPTHCLCADGLSENGNGECRGEFDAVCDNNGPPCDESKFLECSQGKCACQSGMIDLGKGECKQTLGGSCAEGQECHSARHLICGTNHKCECEVGLEDNGKGECRTALGGSCAAGMPSCNDGNFLECKDKTCQCTTPLVANEKGECRAILNGACNAQAPCDDLNYLVCSSGKCLCKSGLVNNGKGQCRARYGYPCAEDKPCDDATFLVCGDNSKCQCRPDLTDLGLGKCRAKFGASCASDEVRCDETSNLICGDDNLCKCKAGLDPNADNQCRAGFGQSCGTGLPCDTDKFMVCGAGAKCSCSEGSSYESIDDTCLYLEGDACGSGQKPKCAPNSYCKVETDGKGACKCLEGLQVNGHRRCFLQVGQLCNPMVDQCDFSQFHHCDVITARCACQASLDLIEESAGVCRIRAGAHCIPPTENPDAKKCTTNSLCLFIGAAHSCVCDGDLSTNQVGKCVLGFGAECDVTAHGVCDADGFQSCHLEDGRCSCLDVEHMEFDHESEKCYLNLGSSCTAGSVIECQIHAHTHCLDGSCKCLDGWSDDGYGNCVQKLSPRQFLFGHKL